MKYINRDIGGQQKRPK